MTSPGKDPGNDATPSYSLVAPPARQLRWRRVFPGREEQLSQLRRWLGGLLPAASARDDVVMVAVELATNAVTHTASGRGGWFAVEVTWYGPMVRVVVADQGAPSEPRVTGDLDSENGRGLLVVQGLSTRTGISGDQRGRLIWADVPWHDSTTQAAVFTGGPYEAVIRDGEAALARRFAGIPAWFGRSTLQWWAVTDADGLVTAPSARELAGLLYRLQYASPHRDDASDTVPATVREAVDVPGDTQAGCPVPRRPLSGLRVAAGHCSAATTMAITLGQTRQAGRRALAIAQPL
jgi:anti-sigma regulatory factor (Ser/Thr protein kinase)